MPSWPGIRATIPSFSSYSRPVRRASPPPLKFPVSRASEEFRARFFPLATSAEWCDWRWQLRNRVRSIEALEKIVRLTADERTAIERHSGSLPFAITPYYLSLLDPDTPDQPLRRTMIPATDEYLHTAGEAEDPLSEDKDSPVPCIVHRYPDRVLFLVANSCASNCRYCTRSRMVENPDNNSIFFQAQWEEAIAYIDAHTEVRDVLLSGGDPLTLSDEKLDWLLSRSAPDPPRRVHPHRDEGPGGHAAAHHRVADARAAPLPPAVDEHPLHAPRRAHAGNRGGLRPACRRRDPAGEPDGAPLRASTTRCRP